MLLKKIHHLKDEAVNKVSDYLKNEVEIVNDREKRIEFLEKKLSYFEEQIKTQNTLNSTLLKSIEAQERDKERLNKDMQLLVVALKDVYSLFENTMTDEDSLLSLLLKKNKKNDTYH